MKDGILNIYKEKGYTSHDVVAIVRKKLNTKKVGHTGTLDPEAEGVLPVCIGKATKVANYITDTTKTYIATITLGISTDTQDHTGKIIEEKKVTVTDEEKKEAIRSFIGEYNQIPPMYSALKVNGKKLYELARAGQEIKRQPRKIHIFNINILNLKGNDIDIEVVCSKGTYIRTLCSDIGDKLGCGAHMSKLVRTKSSIFNIEESNKLEAIDYYVKEGRLDTILTKIEEVFNQYNQLIISSDYNKYLFNGNKLDEKFVLNKIKLDKKDKYRVYDENKNFIGIYEVINNEDSNLLKPIKIFI